MQLKFERFVRLKLRPLEVAEVARVMIYYEICNFLILSKICLYLFIIGAPGAVLVAGADDTGNC